jgi:hypothetical protein
MTLQPSPSTCTPDDHSIHSTDTALPSATPTPAAELAELAALSPLGPTSQPARPQQQPQPPLRPSPQQAAVVEASTTKLARTVSPGLLARMKFLNNTPDAPSKTVPSPAAVGRIAEHKIKQLDEFHSTKRTFSIERRGTTWSSSSSNFGTPLIPQLTGESVPPLVMERDGESDRSSVVSTSDKVLPSESEADHDVLDMQKYRLPDITKTKSLTSLLASPTQTPPDLARPPTPPPKDSPPLSAPLPPLPPAPPAEEASVLDSNHDLEIASYFTHRHLRRTDSIYTLSKASFSNQLQQLTSMKLPPTTIASEITALPSSTLAGRALHKAANDIRLWMAKATEVLNGLDADDDVEWAAAAGREGLADVDAAVSKFEGLVTVYITAIEDLQSRSDIVSLPVKDQTTLITQMEEIVSTWSQIKHTLKDIKNQVEIAMEWEELWNTVLGEIGAEVEELSRLVFEMEERRHRVISDSVAESAEKFDLADLETIVEVTPRPGKTNSRLNAPPAVAVLPPNSPIPQIEKENTNLLALFAKLQPLRASLDFLPMRLASFQMRASNIFPSACEELMRRKDQLEQQEAKLEADADSLREELGEDKWVHSFRQAGSKAVAMYGSCMKSIQRLCQAIEDGDDEKIGSRISTYKDKSAHYPPSMKRVLELIDIEMKHRSTVNGEILRIQQDVRQKVADLETETQQMDAVLEDMGSSHRLRDSVSTILSARTEASLSGSAFGTPGSSPASSTVVSRKNSDYNTPTGRKTRQISGTTPKSALPANRRYSSMPAVTTMPPRKSLPASSHLEPVHSRLAATPTQATLARSTTPVSEKPSLIKPRWNVSTNLRDTIIGHHYKPPTLATPSPRRRGETPDGSRSSIPVRTTVGRSSTLSPALTSRPPSTTPAKSSFRRPVASPVQSSFPSSAMQTPSTPSSNRRVTIADNNDDDQPQEESPIARRAARPASAMTNRRGSLLPTPKSSRTASGSIVTSPPSARPGSRLTTGAGDGRSSRVGARQSSMGVNGRHSSLGLSGRQSSQGDRVVWR